MTPVQQFDQAHGLYNAVAATALEYAESPIADPTVKAAIKQVVVRTGPVVIRGSEVIDKVAAGAEPTGVETLYIEWGKAAIEEAMSQLSAWYLAPAEDK